MHPIPHGIGAHARWSRLQPMPDADHGEPIVTLTDAPTAEEEHAVGSGLARFNEQQSGIRDSRPLAVVVRDPQTKQPVGGLTGRTALGLLFIDLFFLPDNLRGGGLGSRLLRLAEDEARRRGCVSAVLYTISFQAPGFYERHGYRVLGTVPCLPPGTSRVFMTKPLT
jgi:GNAT superfamily N-acetyltransferase